MKKICFVTNNISSMGGLQRVISVVANQLSKNANYEVSILFTSPIDISKKPFYELSKKIKVHYTDSLYRRKNEYIPSKILARVNEYLYNFNNIKLLKKIYFPSNEIKKYQTFFTDNPQDIIIGNTPRYAALITLLNDDSKKIGWFHSTYSRYFENKGYYRKQKKIYYELLSKLDSVVVLSNHDKKEFSEKFDINTTKIYNPLSFEATEKNNLTSKSLLYIGRIQYATKGLDLLIEITKKLVQIKSDIQIDIVGDGPDIKRLISDIKSNKLENNIILHGPTSEVEKFYLSTSAVILPSRVEGFGLVVTEAMEYGVPVVSFETEGPSEIITDKVDGFLVSKFDTDLFASRCIELINNSELRKKIGYQAVKRANFFSVDNIIDEWNNLFDEIIKE